jgi:MFS family permease
MTRRAVAALGIGQLVNWGVLYYAFAVLLPAVQSDLEVPTWAVTGAFSAALLVAAAMAPTVGRWSDKGHAARAITLGSLTGAVLLATWALLPGVTALYAVWVGLGVCMALSLYEPAFAIVLRAHASPDTRLRALATITVFGGLASTAFLPLTALLVNGFGWRVATVVLAGVLALSAGLSAWLVRDAAVADAHANATQEVGSASGAGGLGFLAVAFGMASLASAAFIANLVPALGERGISPARAGLLGGLFGVMQLPGRALIVSRRLTLSAPMLLGLSLGLQALGLLMVAALATTAVVAMGVVTFATGAGLTIVARPYVVQSAFPIAHSGQVNGRLARVQAVTRALGPIAASAVASVTSQTTSLAILAIALAVLAILAADLEGLRVGGVASFWSSLRLRRRRHHIAGTQNANEDSL